jgi:rRNA maturation endonuclease Nob1
LPLGQEKTRAQKHQSMTLAHRFKRVFNVDSETCEQCGGAVKVRAILQRQIGRKADLHSACCPQG